MKTLLITTFFLVPLPAFAASSITVAVDGVQEVWNLSDIDQQKFEAWVQYTYKCKDAGPSTPCTPYTLAESEALWAQATLKGTANNVDSFQNAVASKVATDATKPIGFSVNGTKTPNMTPQKIQEKTLEKNK